MSITIVLLKLTMHYWKAWNAHSKIYVWYCFTHTILNPYANFILSSFLKFSNIVLIAKKSSWYIKDNIMYPEIGSWSLLWMSNLGTAQSMCFLLYDSYHIFSEQHDNMNGFQQLLEFFLSAFKYTYSNFLNVWSSLVEQLVHYTCLYLVTNTIKFRWCSA